jgi:TatD DNase family protein
MIVTGGNMAESREALGLARGAASLFSTVGVHPTRCNEFLLPATTDQNPAEGPKMNLLSDAAADDLIQAHLDSLLSLAREGMVDKKVVAIGEVGLDYDRLEFCGKDVQLRCFEAQLQLAAATELPLFLHLRNAANDFINIMTKNKHMWKKGGGVVHSFDGTLEEARELLTLGLFIGINGCSLKHPDNCAVVANLPADKIMLETDAPWCDIRPTHASYKVPPPFPPSLPLHPPPSLPPSISIRFVCFVFLCAPLPAVRTEQV